MANQEDMIRSERLQKLNNIIKFGLDPYPSFSNRSHYNNEVSSSFNKYRGKKVTIAGRIISIRKHGRITFFSLKDISGNLQILFKEDILGKKEYKFLKNLDIGDFLEASGKVFKTRAGEITIEVNKFRILSKSLLPIPEKFHGLRDIETRYRKRYLDFLTNDSSKEKMVTRSKVISFVRKYLEDNGFLEMQFPVLEVEATGAAAKPFKTHYNTYDEDVYLRICIGELWQKRAIIGGFEKTFEIGKAFRNEGVSAQHNPEFVMCEFYWAYVDYKKMMKFTEGLISQTVKNISGSYVIKFQGSKINFKPPYPKHSFKDLLNKHTKLDIDKYPTKDLLVKELNKRKFKYNKDASRGTLIDEFYKEMVRPKIKDPIFLIDHPVEISPLAKENPKNPGVVERFQLVVNGTELINAYSELNDPQIQKQRLNEQSKLLRAGDEESQRIDLDYIEALEYGMPPVSGNGIGIERLVMLLTDSAHMRESTPFPFMKPENKKK